MVGTKLRGRAFFEHKVVAFFYFNQPESASRLFF